MHNCFQFVKDSESIMNYYVYLCMSVRLYAICFMRSFRLLQITTNDKKGHSTRRAHQRSRKKIACKTIRATNIREERHFERETFLPNAKTD